MIATIYRGTREIGGTLIELASGGSRVLLDAGYPLFLNGDSIGRDIENLPTEELLRLGVLPAISGLYAWDEPNFDGIVISHAHVDHYGLLKYVHSDIPVYLSAGTKALIELSQAFKIYEPYSINGRLFKMYEPFQVGAFTMKAYLMDHSAFDAAAFEICCNGKRAIYSGDFRGHGRKPGCLSRFIDRVDKQGEVLFAEGSLVSRSDELTLSEEELEKVIGDTLRERPGITLFQSAGQNIDRLVSFYKATKRMRKTFVVDVYTANILHELRALGNKLPYPSDAYSDIKVFFPYSLTEKIFDKIGADYAKRFSRYRISREQLKVKQNDIIMLVRPSLKRDLQRCNLLGGTFIYSMWQGYRSSDYQQSFENWLNAQGFQTVLLHTSGHAKVSDIRRLIDGLVPKKIVPVHTLKPEAFLEYSSRTELQQDGIAFEI